MRLRVLEEFGDRMFITQITLSEIFTRGDAMKTRHLFVLEEQKYTANEEAGFL